MYVNRVCVRGCVFVIVCVAAFFKLRWRSRYSVLIGCVCVRGCVDRVCYKSVLIGCVC